MRIVFAGLALMLAACGGTTKSLIVDDATYRAPLTDNGVGVADFSITSSTEDRIIGMSSPQAERLEMHNSVIKDGLATMEQLDLVELPAGKTAVPAHYCHSSGNFSLYDPAAGILFSGDIGGALVPDHHASLVVADFEQHIQYMRGFHLRWMPSTVALRGWVQRVRAIKPKMICPQHGSIFEGENVGKLLDWLESLEVGQRKDSAAKTDTRAAA